MWFQSYNDMWFVWLVRWAFFGFFVGIPLLIYEVGKLVWWLWCHIQITWQ
jgi:hypothetical protein